MAHRSYAHFLALGALITAPLLSLAGCDSSDTPADARVDSAARDTGTQSDVTTGVDVVTETDATTQSDAGNDAADAAAAPDLSCVGRALPTTAPATVSASGVTKTALGAAISGAMVQIFSRAGSSLGTGTSAATTGAFTVSASTGGTPLDAYLTVSVTGSVPVRVYPPYAVSTNLTDLDVRVPTTSDLDLLYSTFAGVTRQSGLGSVVIAVQDCAHEPIAGATVSFAPAAGATRYSTGASPFPTRTATSTGASGVAYGLNVPVGNVVVTATVGSQALRPVTVTSIADGVTQVIVEP